jgi:UDP-N-acetylmuramate dehydrogenase
MTAAVSLQTLHTLGLIAEAEHLIVLDRMDDWPACAGALPKPLHILGGGSNLVPARRVDGTVVRVALRGRRLVAEDDAAWTVAAAAGEPWHEFVMWTLAQGWPGLENLALIPGTVGAAPIQNIGAYGVELKDRFHSLTAMRLEDGTLHTFEAADCAFGYRDSVFKRSEAGRWLITEVRFRLPKHWMPVLGYGDLQARMAAMGGATPVRVAEAVMTIRRSKLPDPAVLGNAGSFFHNPIVTADAARALANRFPALPHYPQADGHVKLAAGWLIEQAGWRGKRLGPVGMYAQQALVLVNHGGGTAEDVRALMQAVQADVQAMFGVTLQPEPEWW